MLCALLVECGKRCRGVLSRFHPCLLYCLLTYASSTAAAAEWDMQHCLSSAAALCCCWIVPHCWQEAMRMLVLLLSAAVVVQQLHCVY
jgi:hypothetical protein